MVIRLLTALALSCLLALVVVREPTQLHVPRDIRHRLDTLADTLPIEVVVCLTGFVRGDTGYVTGMSMAKLLESTPYTAIAEPCPRPETIALWHNHPTSDRPIVLLYQCALSGPDIRKILAEQYEFAVVQPRSTHYCWWTRQQIRQAKDEPYLPRVHGQYDIRQ